MRDTPHCRSNPLTKSCFELNQPGCCRSCIKLRRASIGLVKVGHSYALGKSEDGRRDGTPRRIGMRLAEGVMGLLEEWLYLREVFG